MVDRGERQAKPVGQRMAVRRLRHAAKVEQAVDRFGADRQVAAHPGEVDAAAIADP
jgi:hypothetical protein